jgi:tetratricopeptide (TPR) repeat protein
MSAANGTSGLSSHRAGSEGVLVPVRPSVLFFRWRGLVPLNGSRGFRGLGFRCTVACFMLLLIAFLCAPSLPAQESRWKELNTQVAQLYQQGKYAEALPIAAESLKVAEAAFGPDDARVAVALSYFALLYDHQGKYAEAEPLYQFALRIREKALGPDHPDVATTLNRLAELYLHQGKYAEAEPLLHRALRIDEKALGPDHPDVATTLNNLSALYYEQGRFAEAEPLLRRGRRGRGNTLGPDHRDVARSLNNLAVLYNDQGKYSEAEPLYQRALRIWEKALGPYHPDVAVSLDNLASLYVDQGKYAEAEPLFQRALRILEKALGTDHPDVAISLNNLAVLYNKQGRFAEAESLFQSALRVREKALGPDSPDVATSLLSLAELYLDQGKYAEAEQFYQRSFDNLFQQFQYNFTYMSEKERLGFLDTVAHRFPAYFSFVQRYRENDPQLAGSMYNLLLWEKGFIAGSVADMHRQVEASGDAEALKLLDQLSAKQTQIAALLNPLKAAPLDREQWRKQIDQLKTEANEIEKALVARSSTFAEKKKLERATWQQVRDALQPGEAAVEFARFRYFDQKWTGASYYVALVVTRDTKDQPQYIFLGDDKQIEGDALIRFQHPADGRNIVLIAEPKASVPAAQAWDLIWKPLEAALAGKARVYLSPDGVLNEIPLGIIPAPGGKLQLERYDLRLLSSTKDILRSRLPPNSQTALLVGDPDFDMSEEQQRAAMQKLALPQQEAPVLMAALSPNDRSRDLSIASAPPLPATGEEVNAIAKLMQQRQWKTSVYTGDQALKRVVEGATGPRVVHLATHGFFLSDQEMKAQQLDAGRFGLSGDPPSGLEDPMLRSGLVFAGANRTFAGKPIADGLDNGVLTAMEAANLNLRGTELVVLSACDTGKGDVKNGEGVFGLRRAFQEAGAQDVLMSLWSVPDEETAELMKRFYSKWLGGMEIH